MGKEVSADKRGVKAGGLSARVVKALGLFGGVQTLQVLCGIAKIKFVALWLGPVGIGLFGIFNSAIELVMTVSQLGVRSSAVRDVASAAGTPRSGTTVTLVRRWGLIIGLLGMVLMLCAAPVFSRETFGDMSRTGGFMLLAFALLPAALCMSEQVVLQGLGQLRALARSSVITAVVTLAVVAPMYRFLGLASIIPSIIVAYVIAAGAVWLCRARNAGCVDRMTLKHTLRGGMGFIRLGIYMTVADALAQLASYVFIAWLNKEAGGDEVGFYQSGFTVINRYFGLILTAVSVEYFPRVAAVASSRLRLGVFAAHEALLVTLVLFPAAMLMTALAPYIVRLLYSSEFEAAVPYITLAMSGVLMRGLSYCMSYLMLAKGDGRAYIVTEVVSAVCGLALNVWCYTLWGLAGVGIGYTLWYLLYTLIVAVVYRRRYRLHMSRRPIILGTLSVLATLVASYTALVLSPLWVLPMALLVSVFCLKGIVTLLRR